MTINPVFTDAVPIAAVDGERQFLDDALAGLSAPQKFLSAKYFYDAAGSDLFEAITRLPEYYPTRTELGILDAQGAAIAAALPTRATLVELGSGSTAKVRRLMVHRPDLAAYVPVDVSESFLRSEAQALGEDFPISPSCRWRPTSPAPSRCRRGCRRAPSPGSSRARHR